MTYIDGSRAETVIILCYCNTQSYEELQASLCDARLHLEEKEAAFDAMQNNYEKARMFYINHLCMKYISQANKIII